MRGIVMYEKEAREVINLMFTASSTPERRERVADWLREFLAAREYGCTGLTADPDGPELAEAPALDPDDDRELGGESG